MSNLLNALMSILVVVVLLLVGCQLYLVYYEASSAQGEPALLRYQTTDGHTYVHDPNCTCKGAEPKHDDER